MTLRPPVAALLMAIGLLGFVGVQVGAPADIDNAAQAPAPTASPAPATAPPLAATPSPAPMPQPTAVAEAGAKARVWRRGPRDGKLVALTFDDGWNRKHLGRIVAILERTRTPATFFPVARAVQRHPDLWRSIAQAGFPVANHSWNHDDLSRKSASKARTDMRRATRAIEQVTGRPLFPALRPPYGEYDTGLLKAAGAAGLVAVVMWDVDTRDWTGVRSSRVVRNALAARAGSIIVMHTDKANTVQALPRIIAGLRKRGYTFVTVGQLLGIAGDVPFQEPPQPAKLPGLATPS